MSERDDFNAEEGEVDDRLVCEVNLGETPIAVNMRMHPGEVIDKATLRVERILVLDFVTKPDEAARVIVPVESPLGQALLTGRLTEAARQRLAELNW